MRAVQGISPAGGAGLCTTPAQAEQGSMADSGVDLPRKKGRWGLPTSSASGARRRGNSGRHRGRPEHEGPGPGRGRGREHPDLHRREPPGRGRPQAGEHPEHPAAHRDRHLQGHPAPPGPAGSRPADKDERPPAQGAEALDRREEEEVDGQTEATAAARGEPGAAQGP